MSLTNPNKVVTEERLSEFYQDIFPYLGGMPEMVANKFSKGDIYSTSEKMVGCWIDGKPLYQKTIVNAIIVDDTNLCITTAHNIADIERVISCESYDITNNNDNPSWTLPSAYSDNAAEPTDYLYILTASKTNIRFYRNNNTVWTGHKLTATIKYTKTTDSAVSIGDENDYSTTEKIVGTWIDGKPIWQNTVSTGGNVPSGATLILRMAMASTGYDTILYTKTS